MTTREREQLTQRRAGLATPSGRVWARVAVGIASLLLTLAAEPARSEGQHETGLARVLEVDGDVVVLGAGRMDGLGAESAVTLLREGEPIVHPLTGELLGTPQEPVATVRVLGIEDRRARGGLLRTYSEPRVDDLVEFEIIPDEPQAPAPAVREVLRQVQELQGSVSEYQRSSESLKTYPAFTRRVWSELADMRSALLALDERLVELQEQQDDDHFRLSSVLSGEYRDEELEEITFRYSPDTQIVLEAVGKTVFVRFAQDSTYVLEEAPGAVAYEGMPPLLEGDAADESHDEAPWYQSQWHLAGGAGLLCALLIAVALVVRRRYNDVMGGLDDYDEEFLDDDEEEEEEE